MLMGQDQDLQHYLVEKPYIVNRLYFGSVGAELWSSIMLMLHVASILISGKIPNISLSRVIYDVSPVAFWMLGVIALAHFILLWLPNSKVTILQRKAYICLGMGFWAAVITQCFTQGLVGLGVSISVHVLLLVAGLFRRDY